MHVAVTGASAGIGEAIVRAYAAQGDSVTLVARRKDRLDRIAEEIAAAKGGKTLCFAKDLGDVEQSTSWIDEAEAALGPIDVLVNNAGVQIIGPAEEASLEACEQLLRLNVLTPLRITRTILPRMLERRSGTLVDIASMAALTPMPGMFYYNASKAALANASEGLRGELRGTGVHIVTVYPGPVETDMGNRGFEAYEKTWSTSLSPVGNTTDLARLVVRAVRRKKARIIYPRFYTVSLFFPGIARWFAARFSPPIRRALPP